MEKLEINEQFKRAFEFAAETNRSVFLTGKAGTGKTTLLKYIRDNCFKQISIVAPTGVAAINAGGTTIHSFFQLPFTPFVPPADKSKPSEQAKQLMAGMKLNSVRLGVMRQLELLIIDEVSMVRADVLDAIDVILRSVRRNIRQPFGGVQVFFIGDMYQLPPVVKEDEWSILMNYYKSPFFFDAYVVQEITPVYIELDKIFRQKQQSFVDLLNKVRNNEMDSQTVELLNSRYNPDPNASSDAIVLATHNYIADGINGTELDKIKSRVQEYVAKVEDSFPEKAYPADFVIKLKVGAKVMFIKNDLNKRYFNGKIGTVVKLLDDAIHVQCEGESSYISVVQETWKNIQYTLDKPTNKIKEDVLGAFFQFPLRLAWAITIHKSQGLTFDKVEIDAGKAFSAGQVYVALSRCRSLEGIVLRSKIQESSLANDTKVVEFASQKPETQVVDKFLSEGKSRYIQKTISDLFNLDELGYLANDFGRLMDNFSMHFSAEHKAWTLEFKNSLFNLRGIAQKFTLQLDTLFAESGNSAQVTERLQKAANYFRAEFEKQISHLVATPIITESKEAGREVTGLLESIFRNLSQNFQMLQVCIEPFSLAEYVKVKNNILLPEFKVNVYAVKQQRVDSSIPHPQLFIQLQALRDSICEEENMPIYLVANKASLIDLCTYLPRTKADLLKMKGFGKAKVETIGTRFLGIIKQFVADNNLEELAEFNFPKSAKSAKTASKEIKAKAPLADKGPDTKTLSYELWKEIKSVEKVAHARNLAISTIEGHLAHFVEQKLISLNDIMPEAKQTYLAKIFDQNKGYESLATIKEKCKPDISYSDLKLFAAAHPPEPNKD